MSTEERDTAQRCDRCERMTTGTRVCRWEIATTMSDGPEHVALSWRLCRKCRYEITAQLRHMIREAVTW